MTPSLASLRTRRLTPELMDDASIEREAHVGALRALSRLNALAGSARVLWPTLRDLARERPIRVLDLATGSADLPLALERRARRARLALELSGCDASVVALDHARAAARRASSDLQLFQLDVVADELPRDYDVLVTSTFLHHLETRDAVHLLARMADAARALVLVNDLERSALGYALAWTATRALTRSKVAQVDGPRSIAAAFRRAEVAALAREAGLQGARVEAAFPCRWLLTWRR